MTLIDWDAVRSKTKHRCREYFFRTMPKIPPTVDNELARVCAEYGMEAVWHEGAGIYLVGKDDRYYGVIGADWREEGLDLSAVIAELFVTGTFRVDP